MSFKCSVPTTKKQGQRKKKNRKKEQRTKKKITDEQSNFIKEKLRCIKIFVKTAEKLLVFWAGNYLNLSLKYKIFVKYNFFTK